MNKKKRKIIIFTGDDIFYAPLLLENLLKNKKSDIHHVYISKSFLSFKRLSKKLFFLLEIITLFVFRLKIGSIFLRCILNLKSHVLSKMSQKI